MNSIFDPTLPENTSMKTYWDGIAGCAKSVGVCHAANAADAPIVLICESNEKVEHFLRELTYFSEGFDRLPVFALPDWETLPYDNFSPHQDITSERLRTLYNLPKLTRGILVISMPSLMHKLPPREYIVSNSLDLVVGQQLELDQVKGDLVESGYKSVNTVLDHGEFAIRGSILDIYPMGSTLPYRIDLFDNEIETLRTFDPETQRSISKVKEIKLLPAKEFPLDEDSIRNFRTNFHEFFDVDPRQCPIYQDVSNGIASPGLEYYLSLFFESLDTVFEFLPSNSVMIKAGDVYSSGSNFWQDVHNRYSDKQIDRFKPIVNPREVFVEPDILMSKLKHYRQIEFKQHKNAQNYNVTELPESLSLDTKNDRLTNLADFTSEFQGKIIFCAETEGRQEVVIELLERSNIYPDKTMSIHEFLKEASKIGITTAPLDQGMLARNENLAVITESQLFGKRITQRRMRRKASENVELILKNLAELKVDDAVVHFEHGVGRYRGLETITTDDQATEFLVLEYAKATKLFIPVTSLHLISRYSGGEQESVILDTLGNESWRKSKRKAAEKIHDVATELLEVYAKREARSGFKYKLDQAEYSKFSSAFTFEETPDQANAIESVITDMQSDRPMDRLICGDVGFGKTEVAMRAAFVAVKNSKQIVILVPTTLLAQQHYESFRDRFSGWPIIVEQVSRFKSASEQKDILKRAEKGCIDILIGTHKLLHTEIKYKNLGLIIVDEEHRFGVRQKEKLKAMRTDADILTLTATPIPRTLNMALSEIRDLSLIVTPPARRLSVKTFVREYQESIIREALTRELLRGGQVFYLHNEVKTIVQASEKIESLIPEARVCVAHGQMPERALEKIMADFYHKKYNILVCTTIIETGIDIPSANTIVINRADKFGLAQLHQLRGRVGRSHHQAYAYLLMPNQTKLSTDAYKRIEAIQAATTLGAGFTLASHDLEIRGAGELLGDEQSGHIQKIGFSLYFEMLEDAIKAIKSGKIPANESDSKSRTEINLRIPALIPEDYLPDVHSRLIMYKRISSASDTEALDELQIEMIDRFGMLPPPLKRLFLITTLKQKAELFGIKKIESGSRSGNIQFSQSTNVDPECIINLVQKCPKLYKLVDAHRLSFSFSSDDPDSQLKFVSDILEKLKLNNQIIKE